MSETAEQRVARHRALVEKVNNYISHPWILYHEPFQITDQIYFVGNRYVSTYLIDTGEGLVVIDPALVETTYLVFDSIRKLGFDPEDIHHIYYPPF